MTTIEAPARPPVLRRRSRWEFSALAALTVGLVAAVAVAVPGSDGGSAVVAPADGSPPAEEPTAPDGFRLVGFEDVAIAVPTSWGTNRTRCGTPVEDTVIVDPGGVRGCLIPRRPGIETVTAFQDGSDFSYTDIVEVDGFRAYRREVACGREPHDEARVCSGLIYLAEQEVGFRVTSSSGPEQAEELLRGVRVVPGLIGVPGFRANGTTADASDYVVELRALGFAVEVQERAVPGSRGGSVQDVSPAPGTMARAGELVVVTASAPPNGPADTVLVSLASTAADGRLGHHLTDEHIRAGAVLVVRVGDRLRAYGKGAGEDGVGGELHDDVLSAKGRAAWVAVRPGRTLLTLIVTRAGVRDVVGTVTVVVREFGRTSSNEIGPGAGQAS